MGDNTKFEDFYLLRYNAIQSFATCFHASFLLGLLFEPPRVSQAGNPLIFGLYLNQVLMRDLPACWLFDSLNFWPQRGGAVLSESSVKLHQIARRLLPQNRDLINYTLFKISQRWLFKLWTPGLGHRVFRIDSEHGGSIFLRNMHEFMLS
jgi:hypothetical protein